MKQERRVLLTIDQNDYSGSREYQERDVYATAAEARSQGRHCLGIRPVKRSKTMARRMIDRLLDSETSVFEARFAITIIGSLDLPS